MAYEYVIRIHYPLETGHMVLRAEPEWERDVQPTAILEDNTVFEFRLEADEPCLYFKPCIRDGSAFHWSVGTNYLASLEALNGKDVYPQFFSGVAGTVTKILELPSDLRFGPHRLRVYLPAGYQENHLKRYPVLYMHDGANLFFPEEAFGGAEWQIDETMDLLDSMNVIDKVIVVGVYANDRGEEYTQSGYQAYGEFLTQQLKRAIDANFRTLPQPEWTAVMGSSLGGVVSLFLGWQWPDVYGKVACLSSTFSWYDDLMQRIARESRRDIRIYLDSGWPSDNYEVTRSMRDLLLRRGYQAGKDVLYLAFPNARHNERDWSVRAHIPFQFFFQKTPQL